MLPNTLTALLHQTIALMKQLGTVLSIAFSDVETKTNLIDENYQYWCECLAEDEIKLSDLITEEKDSNVWECNGSNNDNINAIKNAKHEWKRTYKSSSRTITRISWFINFLNEFFYLLHSTDMSSADLSKQAYNNHLADNHNFVVRAGANLALNIVPTREAIAEAIGI